MEVVGRFCNNGIPVSIIYLSEKNDGAYSVIDRQ